MRPFGRNSNAVRGISSTAFLGIIVILVIIAAAGWTAYAAFPTTKTQTISGQTVTTSAVGGCSTSSSSPTKVTVGTTVLGGPADLATDVAEALGFFSQQGLSVTDTIASATVVTDSFFSGQINFDSASLGSQLSTFLQGEQSVALVPQYYGSGAGGIVVSGALYTSGAVTKLSDLNGQKVGTVVGPSASFYNTILESKYYNVSWTQVTYASDTLLGDALESGQIAAAAGLNEATAQLFSSAPINAVVLLDPDSLTPSAWSNILSQSGYPVSQGAVPIGATVWATPTYVQQNPTIVQEFVNAYVEAMVWIEGHNVTQVLNVAYQDPALQVANESSYLGNVEYLKDTIPTSLAVANSTITPNDWDASVYYSVATSPSLAGNETNLLGLYNTAVNQSFLNSATFCVTQANWAPY